MITQCECQSVQLGFTREPFPPGTHICLIFNDESERKKTIARFVERGLMDNEEVFYLADEITPEETLQWLEETGADLSGCVIETAKDIYCPDGYFSPDEMLEKIKQYYLDSMNAGYPACRVTGEMSWALRGIPGSEKLMEYESRLNIVLPEYPITAICQYNTQKFSGDTIFECLRVHPYMIVNHQIVRNPYYIPPEEYLRDYFGKNG